MGMEERSRIIQRKANGMIKSLIPRALLLLSHALLCASAGGILIFALSSYKIYWDHWSIYVVVMISGLIISYGYLIVRMGLKLFYVYRLAKTFQQVAGNIKSKFDASGN